MDSKPSRQNQNLATLMGMMHRKVDQVADMMMDMEVDKVADMMVETEVDMVTEMVVKIPIEEII